MKKISFILVLAIIFTTLSIPALYASAADIAYFDFEDYTSTDSSTAPSGWTAASSNGKSFLPVATGDYHGTALQMYSPRGEHLSDSDVNTWYSRATADIDQAIDTTKQYVFSFDFKIPEIIDLVNGHQLNIYVRSESITTDETITTNLPLMGWQLKVSNDGEGLEFQTYNGNGKQNGKWWYSNKLGLSEQTGAIQTVEAGKWYHLDAKYNAANGQTLSYSSVQYYIDGKWVDQGPAALTTGTIGTIFAEYKVGALPADGSGISADRHGILIDNVKLTTADNMEAYSTKIVNAKEGATELYIPFDTVVNPEYLENADINIEKFAYDDVIMKEPLNDMSGVYIKRMLATGIELAFNTPLTKNGDQYRLTISGINDTFGNNFKVLYDIAVNEESESVKSTPYFEEFEDDASGIPAGWDHWRLAYMAADQYPGENVFTYKDVDGDNAVAVTQKTTTSNHIAAMKKATNLPIDDTVESYTFEFDLHIPNIITATTAADGTTPVTQYSQIQLSVDNDGSKPGIGFRCVTENGTGMRIAMYIPRSTNQYLTANSSKVLAQGGDYSFKAVYTVADKTVIYYLDDEWIGSYKDNYFENNAFKYITVGGRNRNVNVDNPGVDYNCYVKNVKVTQVTKPVAEVSAVKFTNNGKIIPAAEIMGKNEMTVYFKGSAPDLSDGDVVLKRGSDVISHTGSYDADNNTYTMMLSENFAYMSDYTLTIEKLGFELAFKTLSGYEVTDLAIEGDIADYNLQISGKIKNVAGTDETVLLMLAMYDDEGYLDMYTEEITVTLGSTADIATDTIIPAIGTTKVKCFVWSDLSDMIPLTTAISK